MENYKIKIELDGIDEATEKTEKLVDLLKQANSLTDDLTPKREKTINTGELTLSRSQYRELLTDIVSKGHEIVMQMNSQEESTDSSIVWIDGNSSTEKLDSISKFVDALCLAETSIVDPMKSNLRRV